MHATLEQAREAKEQASELLASLGLVAAVGITRRDGSYAVKLNLQGPLAEDQQLPGSLGGVPLVVEVVGRLRKR